MSNGFRIGVITTDSSGWHSGQLLAAAGRVARVAPLSPLDITVRIDGGATGVWFGSESAESFDAVLLRGIAEDGLADFQLEAYRILEDAVPVVVNRVEPILVALDKCRTSYVLQRAGLPTPPTIVTQDPGEAEAAVRRFGEAVLKPLYGSLGEGIVRVKPGREAAQCIARMVRSLGAIYVQRFEPPGGRDIRAFVVGGTVVAAIYRVAQDGEWITNTFRGATAEPISLPAEVESLAVRAAAAVGLDYTGVDVIETRAGPTVIEVNGTPSWMGVDRAWHRSMAEEIVGLVVRRITAHRKAGAGRRAAA